MRRRRTGRMVSHVLALLAGPGMTAFEATATWSPGWKRRAIRCLGLVLPLLGFLLFLSMSMRQPLVIFLWAALCLGAGVVGMRQHREQGPGDPGARDPRFWSLLPSLVCAISALICLAHMISWAVLGRLSMVQPWVGDLSTFVAFSLFDACWAIPAILYFFWRSEKEGRLLSTWQLGRATASWLSFLVLLDVLVLALYGLVETPLMAVPAFDLDGFRWFWVRAILGLLSPVFVWRLAWGEGRWRWRFAGMAAVLVSSLISLGILTGGVSRGQLALGLVADRQEAEERALGWYERVLASSSNLPLRAYLQHRLGLLYYRLGDRDKATDYLRQAVAAPEAERSIVEEGQYFLQRLPRDPEGKGARARIPGLKVGTEMRGAYCAPNTMALILRYWGHDAEVAEVGEAVAKLGQGTWASDMRLYFDRLGLRFYWHPFAKLEDLRWLIDRGIPALLSTPGHVLAVYGYDDGLGTVATYDTARLGVWVERPYPDLMQEWAGEEYLLGIVLPAADRTADIAEARHRYGGPRSVATWHWLLSAETESDGEREAQLRRGLNADPSLFLNAFDLPESEWLWRNGDFQTAEKEALEVLGRPDGSRRAATGLARLYFATERYTDAIGLAEELRGRGLSFSAPFVLAGRSAAALGRWREAAAYLAEQQDEETLTGYAWMDLARARAQLEDWAGLAAALELLAGTVRGPQLAEVLDLAGLLPIPEGRGAREVVYRAYLRQRPYAAKVQVEFARLLLSKGGSSERAESLHEAELALALAETEVVATGMDLQDQISQGRQALERARQQLVSRAESLRAFHMEV